MMKAAFCTQYGNPDNISVRNIATPAPGDHDLLVEVYAATVNRSDCAILEGSWIIRLFTGLTKPRKPVPGTDFAGKVVQTGKKVNGFKPGDRVFGFFDMGLMSHAEFLTIRASKTIRHIPQDLSYADAVASLEGVHYAVNFINKIQTRPGQKVMINGATGAIGSALVQLCRFYDLDITATCRAGHSEVVQKLGARKVIDYTKESFLNTEERYDFVFDAVGKSTFGQCKRILKDGGVYISSELGPRAENPFLALTTKIAGSKKVKFPIPFDVGASITFVLDLIEQEKFQPLIDRTYTLDEIQEAFSYVDSGQKAGNVVLMIRKA